MDEYLGAIKIFAGTYAPENFMLCQGQSLSVQNYSALFSIIGTTYGGDGVSTFNLPDLRMRIPVGVGQGINLSPIALAQTGGSSGVTLTPSNLPAHTHAATMQASTGQAASASPVNTAGCLLAEPQAYNTSTQEPLDAALYAPAQQNMVQMSPNTGTLSVSTVGVSSALPHNNQQPYIVINYIICVNGIYPGPQN